MPVVRRTSLVAIKKGKVLPYSLPSVGPGADLGVQVVSPQETWSESRHKLGGRLPLLSARPAVTSSTPCRAATNLYRLVTEVHGCEQLAHGCYPIAPWPGVELTLLKRNPNALTITLPSHPLWRLQKVKRDFFFYFVTYTRDWRETTCLAFSKAMSVFTATVAIARRCFLSSTRYIWWPFAEST